MDFYRQVHNLSLIIQPGDSFFPIVDAIDSATRSIKMTIFRMDDPIVLDALSFAVTRNVKVQALIALASKGWTKRNKKLGDDLAKLGVEVRMPRVKKDKIKRYHYKIMMIDDSQSLILTFNPTQKNLHYARDFGVRVRDNQITTELNRLFDADWHGQSFRPADLPLVISPLNSRKSLMEFIDSATRSIRILDAKLEDQQVMGLLLRKASSGCDVKIISRDTYYHQVVPNLHVKKLSRYKLHAKCVVVDGARFFVGSQNLRAVSLDRRREVGILVEDDAMSRRIERVFDEDWTTATEIRPAAETNVD
ncbi:MAG TPA: phospholipase D-like domain-containing protein [Blastocatellia bacterium]|jgi:phosphatidylserine/phosphatidylglycerophosphate/cardiolipin synthase-like enzyme|nr:phospholipase D-like domain-containing protein [Blastocatellia bacterium]